jgi:hypothetical protein
MLGPGWQKTKQFESLASFQYLAASRYLPHLVDIQVFGTSLT